MRNPAITAEDGDPIQAVALETVRCRILPDGRMTREDAAKYLGLKVKTLAMWALQGKGPRFVRVGGRAFYYLADVDAFVRGEVA
jgi:hypothetical protein